MEENKIIILQNYSTSDVYAEGMNRNFVFEASEDGVSPVNVSMPFYEVQAINNKSNLIKEGFLVVGGENVKEVYEALYIQEYKNILSYKDIKEIILKPTKDGLQRLVNIKTLSYFERVRSIFFPLYNSGAYDISIRVKELVEKRYKELYEGKTISSLQVLDIQNNDNNNSVIAENLKNENEELRKRIEALEKQIAKPKKIVSTTNKE